MNFNQQTKHTLEKQVAFLMEAFSKCLGVTIEDDFLNLNSIELKNKYFPIILSSDIEDIEDFGVALETLNQLGSDREYSFKIGTQKQKKGGSVAERKIICKLKDRNKEKHTKVGTINQKQEQKKLIKDIDCPVKYRFQVNGGKVRFLSSKEEHNHGPNLNFSKKLLPQMIQDIAGFKKTSSPSTIREFLENKYDVKLDYMTVYNRFRNVFPRFGVLDCQNFVEYLKKTKLSTELSLRLLILKTLTNLLKKKMINLSVNYYFQLNK